MARPGHGKRLNPVIGGGAGMDVGIFGHRFFDLAGDQLLHLIGADARPLASGDSHADGNIRVFALRHVRVAVPAPQHRSDQNDPGNLAMLGEKTSGVMILLDQIGISSMRHRFLNEPALPDAKNQLGHLNYGTTLTWLPSLTSVAPTTITRSPTLTPWRHADAVAKRLADLNIALMGDGFAALFLHHKHRETIGIFGGADDGAERNHIHGVRQLHRSQIDGGDHSGLELILGIRNGDFDREDAALRIGIRRNGSDAPVKYFRNAGGNDGLGIAQMHAGDESIGNAEHGFHQARFRERESQRAGSHQIADFRIAIEHPAVDGRFEGAIIERGLRLRQVCFCGFQGALAGVELGLSGIELRLRQALRGIEIVGASEIKFSFLIGSLRLLELALRHVDLVGVIRGTNLGENLALRHGVAGLHAAHPAVRTLALSRW